MRLPTPKRLLRARSASNDADKLSHELCKRFDNAQHSQLVSTRDLCPRRAESNDSFLRVSRSIARSYMLAVLTGSELASPNRGATGLRAAGRLDRCLRRLCQLGVVDGTARPIGRGSRNHKDHRGNPAKTRPAVLAGDVIFSFCAVNRFVIHSGPSRFLFSDMTKTNC